ncbi:MAG: neutral/alkaline non-lysosomal ceramidase N-terminal domain-containing protein [Dehalococcoidia bacterium]
MTLRAGFAAENITPPVGTMLEGYTANTEPSRGVHDDLFARAIVLDDGATQVAVVSCDLIGVDRRLVAAARERASATTGIPSEHILIAAIHTHQGPAGLRRGGDEPLMDVTARKIAGAITAAHASRREAVLKIGTTTVDSVLQNRRHPDWPVDALLTVLLLDDPDPQRPPIATLINYSCHPTVLYSDNHFFSADYPGHAVRTVEQLFPGAGAMFLNGACGNVNPVWIKQTHEEAERVGRIVGAAAARLVGELRPLGVGQVVHNIRWDEHLEHPVRSGELIDNVRLRAASRRIELPVKSFLPDAEYETTLRELDARANATTEREEHRSVMAQLSRLRTERIVAQRMAAREGTMVHPELQAIALAPGVALLALPGEFFVETVALIREGAGLRHLPVACYANNYIGYVVPAPAYAEGGYEPGVTLLAPEAESICVREALSLLREVAL